MHIFYKEILQKTQTLNKNITSPSFCLAFD